MKKLLCILCMALSLVACDNKDENVTNKPVVKIGMMLPLSGDMASYGDATKRAIEMVKEDIKNTKNHYEFVLEDSGTDTAKAATIIRKLVFTDKINAVMGYISSTAMVVAPIAEENKVPSFWFVSAPEASVGAYNFRLYPDLVTGAEMISKKIKSEKKKSIAIIYQNIPSMNYMVADMLPVYTQELKIVMNENFMPGEKNFFALIQKIKSVKPDYIVCLEDGKKLKMLKRYLKAKYNMTEVEYKEKWGLPKDYPMVAPNYAKKRSNLAKKSGFGQR